ARGVGEVRESRPGSKKRRIGGGAPWERSSLIARNEDGTRRRWPDVLAARGKGRHHGHRPASSTCFEPPPREKRLPSYRRGLAELAFLPWALPTLERQ